MTISIVHLFNEDQDEGAALRQSFEEQGKELKVRKVPLPCDPNSSVERMYDHIMRKPCSAISHVNLKGLELNEGYMNVHNGGHTVVLIGRFSTTQTNLLVSHARLSGYAVHVSSV